MQKEQSHIQPLGKAQIDFVEYLLRGSFVGYGRCNIEEVAEQATAENNKEGQDVFYGVSAASAIEEHRHDDENESRLFYPLARSEEKSVFAYVVEYVIVSYGKGQKQRAHRGYRGAYEQTYFDGAPAVEIEFYLRFRIRHIGYNYIFCNARCQTFCPSKIFRFTTAEKGRK